jgi:nucleotide-binding universal stress UspA family protein
MPRRAARVMMASEDPGGVLMTRRTALTKDGIEITRILVPTDFSPGAEPALRWAATLAEQFGAELIFLHVLDLSLAALAGLPSEVVAVPAVDELARLVRAEATDGMAALAARYPGARTIILEGAPRALIVQVAREEGASLIVMGTHGRTGLGRLLMGSVAEQVVRRAPCPVLTVKTPAPPVPGTPAEAPAANAGKR